MAKQAEDALVAQAFDADKHLDLAKAIEQLSPEEANFFLLRLEGAIKKRKIQVAGYLTAMVVWLCTMVFGLAWFGTHDGFVGWVFLLPFALVGMILFAFGKWADKVAALYQPPPSQPAKV